MNLNQIIFFIFISLLYRLFLKEKGLEWFVLLISIVTIFWLQPISTIRTLDFWLPTFSISLGLISWVIISKKEELNSRDNNKTIVFVVSFILFIGLSRLVSLFSIYKYISAPKPIFTILFLTILCFVIFRLKSFTNKNMFMWGIAGLLFIIFIILKNEFLSHKLSIFLRYINKQSVNLALANEIVWIGFSYFSFRMLHALIESKKRGGVSISLKVYLGYLLYFPAFLAGPIDRINHFQEEILSNKKLLLEDLLYAGERIAIGLFQKFILADLLAIISIDETLAVTITSKFWMWFAVIIYAFRIYFDFNGYSHLAIGISRLLGIQLPENFNKPLLSPTLTIFWNNWHITLTQWFRAYYFNPATRYLKKNYKSINSKLIMGLMQITTMVLIGLWHGISYNFIAWGAWNGIGLFVQNRVTGFVKKKTVAGKPLWQISPAYRVISTMITFIYISLGWVWFELSTLDASMQVFFILFGKK
jgi:D-alanyl-lipoteichoic acid acyltransferase DltB (MBOAT superfamily)